MARMLGLDMRRHQGLSMKWFKALGGLLVITLLFASCIKVDGEVVVADDGAAEVDFLTAVDADRIGDILGELAGDSGQICEDFGGEMNSSDVPFGAQNANVSEYNEDGFCGARIEYTLAPSLDHSDNMSDLFDENTRLFKEGDNWFFESQFSADDITGDAEELGSDFGDLDDFFGDASFTIVIDLPGKAIAGENNATKVQNNGRFTWDIDLLNPPSSLFAQTEPGSDGPDQIDGDGGGGGGGLLRVLGLLLVLGLLGFGVWWFLKNRGGGTSTAATPTNDPGVSPIAGSMPDGTGYTAPPLASGPPVMDAPAGAVGAGASFANPDATKETVVMSSEEAQRFAAEARGQASSAGTGIAGAAGGAAAGIAGAAGGAAAGIGDTASAAAGAAAGGAAEAASPDPVWDEALGAWTINHPTRGRLRHDPASDSWNPI